MTNRWGKLKCARKWVIVLAVVVIGLLLTFALSRKPAVTLEIVELKQELLRGFEAHHSTRGVMVQSEALKSHWVAEMELRNNSSAEIQHLGFFSNDQMPNYECLHWADNVWEGDSGSTASDLAFADHWKRGGERAFAGQAWGLVSLPPGGSLRFRVSMNQKVKPFIVAPRFRTPRPNQKFYSILPDELLDHLPWQKERHQVETEVILNGAKELPPRWASKPDMNKNP
jgi:hypothetical protein